MTSLNHPYALPLIAFARVTAFPQLDIMSTESDRWKEKSIFLSVPNKLFKPFNISTFFSSITRKNLRIFPSVKSLGRNLLSPVLYSIFAMPVKNIFSGFCGFQFSLNMNILINLCTDIIS